MPRNSGLMGRWFTTAGLLAVLSVQGFPEEVRLPPLDSAQVGGQKLSSAERLKVNGFRFEGNQVYPEVELGRITAPYLHKEVTAEDLEKLRKQLTEYYISHGYINSGAVLKDQNIADGIITFTIVEGKLNHIEVSGNKRFARRYLVNQIRRGARRQFNIATTRNALEVLREDPNLQQVNAELQPGARPGEASLHVEVMEANPFHASLQLNNYRPASVGENRLYLATSNGNLTGHDDGLSIRYGLTGDSLTQSGVSGLNDFSLAYTTPPNNHDIRAQISYSRSDSALIEEPFDRLGISSKCQNYALSFRRPLAKTLNREFAMSLALEHRQSKTFLSGIPFSLSPGDVNGESETTALRFGQEWLRRKQAEVFAARSLFSLGIDLLGSTDDGTRRNGKFFSWLGQAQLVRRLGDSVRRMIYRLNAQWTGDPLLSLEQFSVGGVNSVRGYRENQLLRDRGLVASAELRVPVRFTKAGKESLELAPFIDYGYGTNVVGTDSPNAIASAGLGVLYTPNARVNAQVYWGHAFRDFSSTGNDLQDRGIHFSFSYNLH